MIQSLRSLIVSILALWRGLSQKEVGVRSGIPPKQVSYHLKKEDMADDLYARFLAGLNGRPAEIAIVIGCLESLAALSQEDLTAEEQDAVELGILKVAREARPVFQEAVRRSRAVPPLDVYPQSAHGVVSPARRRRRASVAPPAP